MRQASPTHGFLAPRRRQRTRPRARPPSPPQSLDRPRSPRPRAPHPATGLILRRRTDATNLSIEYLPLAALTLLFAFLTIRAEQLWAATRYTGASLSAMQVEVTGDQFAWYFRYPGPDATFGRTRPHSSPPAKAIPSASTPPTPTPPTTIVTSELVLPANREVDLRSTPRTSSTASPSPSCASSKTPSPARPSTSTSPRPPPATTPSSAPSSAASATTA